MLRFDLQYAPLQFKRPSGTSRGVLTDKHAWYITLSSDNSEVRGIGEVSVIPGLTKEFDTLESYNSWLSACILELNEAQLTATTFSSYIDKWFDKPSLFFGLEVAFQDYITGGKQRLFESPFTNGDETIPINGLIWMGDESFMLEQIEEKIADGYSCIKMKIGAIELATELQLLTTIRKQFPADKMILRVDANGAFTKETAPAILRQLADLDIHSIEQPIQAGNWEEMRQLCTTTPCPIALDEELIGIYTKSKKQALLATIQPQYIILKPSLHGGLKGCQEWIEISESMEIPWWITSALESNVGLNAIAQFTATYPITLHQGLGTGGLYVKNTPSQLFIKDGRLGIRNA